MKLKNLFLLFASVAFAFSASAEPIFYIDESTKLGYNLDPETMTADINGTYKNGRVGVSWEGTKLIVPETITYEGQTYKITRIGNFQGSPNLEEVIINHLVELSEDSFYGCYDLSSITLPEGIKHIPDGCFSGTAIKDIDFLPSTVETIGTRKDFFSYSPTAGAFQRCNSLKTVTLKPSVKSLGGYTFGYCQSLEEINLNNGLESIGRGCFEYDTSISSVTIPETVVEICFNAFQNSSLSQIELGNEVRRLGARCFISTKLTEIRLPENLEAIRTEMFAYTDIEHLSVPAGVKRITPTAFGRMEVLNTIVFEDSHETLDFDIVSNNRQGRDPWVGDTQETSAWGMWFNGTNNLSNLYYGRNTATWLPEDWENPSDEYTTVYENPFETLNFLKNITVGPLVTDASQLVFENYPELETVTFLSSIPPTLCPLTAEQAETVVVTVPVGSVDAYRSVAGWSEVKNYIEDGGSSISNTTVGSDAKAEYYDIQGRRIENPSHGIYIKRQGKHVSKIIR